MTILKTELIGEIARRAGADADAEREIIGTGQEASARKR